MAEENPAVIPPSRRVVWFSRIMGWLCWVGIAGTVVLGLALLFDAFPPNWNVRESTDTTLVGSTIDIPGDPAAVEGFRHDWLFRLSGVIGIALFVWALLCAHRIFAGIERGEYFSRGTILALRNFALAVLLDITLAPIAETLARLAYVSRFEHASFTLELAMNGGLLLTLIFAAVVALLSTVMVHAAKIEEENRQFI